MDAHAAEEALTRECERLTNELESLGRPNPAAPSGWEPLPQDDSFEPDPVDRAERATDQEDAGTILADLAARRTHVAHALERIKEGAYGRCEVCGRAIEPERLAADPAATTCAEHR